jgi:pimeloyl-ACP methyl ester carboxylesterase
MFASFASATRIIVITLLAALSLLLLAGPTPVSAAHSSCTATTVPVHLSATDPTTYNLVGQLCSKGPLTGKTVQLLVHGLTYDHNYWDFPVQPQKYSYLERASNAGYAVFAIDRIGVGNSDRPADANAVTVQSGAYILHQLAQGLRNGTIGGTAFPKVMLTAHSLGAAMSIYEAATYADVDGLIISGQLHQTNPLIYTLLGNFYPAQLDPKFASAGLPAGYFTTVPNTRAAMFYSTHAADDVIAQDEALKQTVTLGELSTLNDASAPSLSQQIHVPVLTSVGQQDVLFCNELFGLSCANQAAIMNREASAYSPDACLETHVLAKAGHSTNLHLNAPDWFTTAIDWTNRRIGSDATHPPTQPCL